MFAYTMREQHPGLFVEMRLGKTLVTLRRCALYPQRNPAIGLRILIIAPNSALQSWADEGYGEGWNVARIEGAKAKRIKGLVAGFNGTGTTQRTLFLLNKEAWKSLQEIAMLPWDAVVADESIFLKNATAGVTKFFLKYFRDVPHRWILNGTPCPEGEEEYFCQIAFLRGGAFGFTKYWDFKIHYMRPHPAGFGWIMKPGAADVIRRAVGSSCYVLRRKDAGMDRVKIYERRVITMPPEIEKTYIKAELTFMLSWSDSEDDPEALKTKWSVVVWHWLRRLCGGFIKSDLAWPGKINELTEILTTTLRQEQVVVWCCYNEEVAHIISTLRKKRINADGWTGKTKMPLRRSMEAKFRKKGIRVLVLQQATAQTGMDLSVADTAIYFSTPPGQMARMQTEDRILNLNKQGSLLYIDLVVADSVDVDVLATLKEKIKNSDLSLTRALAANMRNRHTSKKDKS